MNVFPFRKRTPGLRTLSRPRQDSSISYSPFLDDFDEEIEDTRSNAALMTVLRIRADEPAAISLQEIKKQFGIDR